MSQTTDASGIDPRFDPRFQRGYVPDPAEAREQRGAPSDATTTPAPTPAPMPSRTALEPAIPARPASRVTQEDAPAPPEPVDPDALAVFDEVDDEPSPADPWFLAAWAVAVLAVVIGGAFWWAGMMAENPFSGVNQSDRWLQYVGWVVAPPLVEGGLIGIVAMLVWTGIRRARRQRGPS